MPYLIRCRCEAQPIALSNHGVQTAGNTTCSPIQPEVIAEPSQRLHLTLQPSQQPRPGQVTQPVVPITSQHRQQSCPTGGYRHFEKIQSNSSRYTFFFLSTHRTFSRIEHTLCHKTSLNNLKKIEIKPSIFFLPQQYKTRNQQQEENWKIDKHVKIKQPTPE